MSFSGIAIRSLCAMIALAPAFVQAATPDEEPLDLAALCHGFAELPGLSARYREEKYIALLERPLVSEGEIFFAPPDRMARHQHSPERARIVLSGNSLVIVTPRDRREVDLAAQPQLAALAGSFRLLLAGDLEGLREHYEVELLPWLEGWRVQLRPRSATLSRVITSIEILGSHARVSGVRVTEASGDKTWLRFDSVDSARRFTSEELHQLFRTTP